MNKKNRLLVFLFLLLISFAKAQSSNNYGAKGRMEYRADSVSRIIDSLISNAQLLHIVMERKHEGDTTIFYHHYYIDSLNKYLVKCIMDTSFEDYYKRFYRQAVIYFNQGYAFLYLYNEMPGKNSENAGTYFNIFPEANEVNQQLGKLEANWTKESLNMKMKAHIHSEIHFMKFFQKKYSPNH